MMNYYFTSFLLILILLFNPFREVNALEFRKYAGEFMEIGVDARAQSMGGAFTAFTGDLASAYYNPAGLFDIDKTQVAFMHTQQMLVSVNYDFLSIGRRYNENRVLAVSMVRLGIDNIKDSRQALDARDPDNLRIHWEKIKNFNASDYIFSLSMAQKFKKSWILGANVKLIRRNLAEHHANGIGFDVGLLKHLNDKLTVGVASRNVTSSLIAWDTGEKELVKPSLFMGGAYQFNIPQIKSSFKPAMDLIFRGENIKENTLGQLSYLSYDIIGGLEYSYHEVLFLRSGVDEIDRFNFGAGIKIPHVRIDYAFTKYDDELGNSHRVGILVNF